MSHVPCQMTEPLHSEVLHNIVSLKWRGTSKRCVTCRKNTHLWWIRRFSDSGFLDVGFALCQGDAKRRGGIYLSILTLFLDRTRTVREVTAIVGEG